MEQLSKTSLTSLLETIAEMRKRENLEVRYIKAGGNVAEDCFKIIDYTLVTPSPKVRNGAPVCDINKRDLAVYKIQNY